MTISCPVCHHPVDRPDDADDEFIARHPACAQHLADQVTARPCRTCGGLTSARVLDPEPPLCSWCRAAEAGIVPAAPPATVATVAAIQPSEQLDQWVRETF